MGVSERREESHAEHAGRRIVSADDPRKTSDYDDDDEGSFLYIDTHCLPGARGGKRETKGQAKRKRERRHPERNTPFISMLASARVLLPCSFTSSLTQQIT